MSGAWRINTSSVPFSDVEVTEKIHKPHLKEGIHPI